MHVSREARKEALKGYTRAFDTYVDLEEDTIFISDPVFALREPKQAFLEAEHVKRIHKIAIASDIYDGLGHSASKFPTFYDRPSGILRKLESLTHFTLALAEDGEGDIYDSDHSSEDGYVDEHDEGRDSGVEDFDTVGIEPSHRDEQAASLDRPAARTEVESQEAQQTHRLLDRLEKEALAAMSNGYIRHRGNIHFESAIDDADHWDDWHSYLSEMNEHFDEEKVKYPEWVRPKISIMVVKYGLKRLGDFSGPVHYPGDHIGVILEDSEYAPSRDESDFSRDDYWESHDWDSNDEEHGAADYDEYWGL